MLETSQEKTVRQEYKKHYKNLVKAIAKNQLEEINRILNIDDMEAFMYEKDDMAALEEAFYDRVDDDEKSEIYPIAVRLLAIPKLLEIVGDLYEPLEWAATDGDLALVKRFFEIKACYDNAGQSNNYVLDMTMCERGTETEKTLEVIRYLLTNPNIRNDFQSIENIIRYNTIEIEVLQTVWGAYSSTECELNFSVMDNPELNKFKEFLKQAIDKLSLPESKVFLPSQLAPSASSQPALDETEEPEHDEVHRLKLA